MGVHMVAPRGHSKCRMTYRSWICRSDFLGLQSSRQGSVLSPLWPYSCSFMLHSLNSVRPTLPAPTCFSVFFSLLLFPPNSASPRDSMTGKWKNWWQFYFNFCVSWNVTFLCKIWWGLKQRFCSAIRTGFYRKLAISSNSVYNRKTCLHLASLSPQQLGSAVVTDSR